jgi:hypothetical protein
MVVPFICFCHNLFQLLDIAFTKFMRIPQKDNDISPQDNPWAGMPMAAKRLSAAQNRNVCACEPNTGLLLLNPGFGRT